MSSDREWLVWWRNSLTYNDRKFLVSIGIDAEWPCTACHGWGCDVCQQTGLRKVQYDTILSQITKSPLP